MEILLPLEVNIQTYVELANVGDRNVGESKWYPHKSRQMDMTKSKRSSSAASGRIKEEHILKIKQKK